MSKMFFCEVKYIPPFRHIGPVFCQHLLAEVIPLHLADRLKACPLSCEVDASGQIPENRLRCVSLLSGITTTSMPVDFKHVLHMAGDL